MVQYFKFVASFTKPEVIKKQFVKRNPKDLSPINWLLGLLQPITKGAFIPLSNPLKGKGELGWKGLVGMTTFPLAKECRTIFALILDKW